MPLVFTLAFRNLFHDRLRFVATVIGIVFSIVLVTVQMGLYLGFGQMVTTMIDHASADLWIMPKGTKCFEDPSLLDTRQRFRALAINGVAEAIPVVIGFADWRTPSGSIDAGFRRRLGFAIRRTAALESGGRPHRVALDANAVAVDRSYFDRLGISGLGATAEIRQQAVQVAAVTNGIRSFTTTPYVFMDVDRARAHTGMPSSKATFLIFAWRRRRRGRVRRHLLAESHRRRGADAGRISRAQPLILAVRHRRGRGAVRGRAARRDRRHRDRRADALFQHQGSPERVRHAARHRLVPEIHLQGHHLPGAAERRDRLWPGLLVGLAVVRLTAATALPIVITPGLTAGLFVLTVVMCIVSAIAAIMKVTRIDPAMVFTR